jgi:CheY-like chemotaxis protein
MTQPHRILCIEDDQDTCEMLTLALKPSGYEVISVHTSQEALRKAFSDRFDAILLDAHLPDLSGIEVCRQIRKFNADTPIIFNSGDSRPEIIEEAIKAGAQAYLRKPVELLDLKQTIANLLEFKAS